MRTLAILVCSLSSAVFAAEKTVAVLPIEVRQGPLSAADAAALTDELRAVAREALAAHGYSIVPAEGNDPEAALEKTSAEAALLGRAAQMEGASVIAVGVYKPGSGAPAALARIVGIGLEQLKQDTRRKLPKLLTGALGITPAVPEPRNPPGTLRIPGGTGGASPAPAPAPAPRTAAPPAPAPQPPPRDENPLVTLIREVTSDVEELRGLRRKQNLKVQILDEKLFSAAVREKAQKELTPAVVAAERARWLAFALAPAAADPGKIILEVLDEQVAGFYDQFSKQLIVRKDPPASAGAMGPEGLRIVLAHEIEHALQDQNFGIPDMRTLPDDDVRLARTALVEGDAMAVMTAYGARRSHKPVKSAIAVGAATLRAVDSETLLRISGKSPALLRAPAVLREELVLPYAAGFALVAEAYRRGGFALVDRMFANPPSSSHQVLHPETYFAGEKPAPVPFPAAPAGTRIVSTGRMGELGTRLALEVCVEKTVVRDYAPHWAGDAYTIVEGANRALTLLWTTAWDGDAARNVANVMRLEVPCWEEQAAAGPGAGGWTVPTGARMAAAGNIVAVARGAGDLDGAVARQLAVKAVPPPPVPPLGEISVPPPAETARVEGGHFVSTRLGLRGDVPEGFAPDSTNPIAELAIKKTGPGGGGASLSFVPEQLSGDALEAFFQSAASQVAAAQGGRLAFSGRAERKLAGAAAEERSWSIEGSGLQLRIEVAPFCGGKASLTILRIEGGEATRNALDRFSASIQSAGVAPACAELE